MDYFDAQALFTQMYPNKIITYAFDENCHRTYEVIFTDGLPNPQQHIESNKVKISVEGNDPVYVSILPHREVCTWAYMKNLIASKGDIVWEAP